MKKINSLPKKEIKTVFMQGNKYLNTLSPLHNIYAETWLSLRSYSNSSVCLQHAFCQQLLTGSAVTLNLQSTQEMTFYSICFVTRTQRFNPLKRTLQQEDG